MDKIFVERHKIFITSNGEFFSRWGRQLKGNVDTYGYVRVAGKRAHRIIAETLIPNPEYKRCVNHIDGDKTNNKASNLEWCTHQENTIHARDVLGRKMGGRPWLNV